MKIMYTFVIIILFCFITGCEEEPVVGSTGSTVIANLAISVDTTYIDHQASRLVAKGRVRNNGGTQVNSPWYVEGQFYTNASSNIKIGGNYTQIGVPLSSGQSTFWTITYTSTNINVNDYPNFVIKDLRGLYK